MAVRILHVTEAFGGGVAAAIASYARSTPQFEHMLLRTPRPGDYTPGEFEGAFARVLDLPRGRTAAVAGVRRAVRDVRPDVVHAHSSFAGAYVRLALRRGRGPRIVYTPHCFAFERLDQPRPARAAYRAVETALAANLDVTAACSEREAALARGLNARQTVVFVPNVSSVPVEAIRKHQPRPGTWRIVTVGRICRQKDPDFFLAVVGELRQMQSTRETHRRWDFTWIGGGPASEVGKLTAAGVRVTGWVDAATVASGLRCADVYVHTAAWEGFPVSILDAHRADLPIVARRIPVLAGVAESAAPRTSREVATRIAELIDDPKRKDNNKSKWEEFLVTCTVQNQARALMHAYGTSANPHDPVHLDVQEP